jgi:outer membrane lipoprotein SlyB
VESVRALERKGDSGMAGAVGGQEVGGGRTAATVAGAGNETERNMNSPITYQVRGRMNDGSHRNHYQAIPPKLSVGQRVRLSDGHLAAD